MQAAEEDHWATYFPRAAGLRDSGLVCLGAGEQCGQVGSTGRRVLQSHALVVVSHGAGRLRTESLDSRVAAPAWFWLFPGRWHDYGPDAAGWTEHWVLFEGIATRGYASYGAWDHTRPLHSGHLPRSELAACFDILRAATAVPGRRGQVIAATVVHRLIGATVSAREPDEPRSVVQALLDGAAEALSVEQRAQRTGVSPGRLRAETRAATGLTPHELIVQTRLSQAQHLLASTDLTVAEIARQIGYDDPAYFSRLFSRRVGLSPSGFRHQHQRRR